MVGSWFLRLKMFYFGWDNSNMEEALVTGNHPLAWIFPSFSCWISGWKTPWCWSVLLQAGSGLMGHGSAGQYWMPSIFRGFALCQCWSGFWDPTDLLRLENFIRKVIFSPINWKTLFENRQGWLGVKHRDSGTRQCIKFPLFISPFSLCQYYDQHL